MVVDEDEDGHEDAQPGDVEELSSADAEGANQVLRRRDVLFGGLICVFFKLFAV